MRILITGGASGLGKEIVKLLARNKNNKVFFTYYKSKSSSLRIEKEFKNTFGIKCNFSNNGDLAKLSTKIAKMEIDTLVNNVVCDVQLEYFHRQNPQVILKSFQNNILSTIKISQEAIKFFRKRKFGKIFTVLSSYLESPPIGLSIYVAEKAYLKSLSESWANENRQFNISVSYICPPAMNTKLQNVLDSRFVLKKNLVDPARIAQKIVKMISSEEVNGI